MVCSCENWSHLVTESTRFSSQSVRSPAHQTTLSLYDKPITMHLAVSFEHNKEKICINGFIIKDLFFTDQNTPVYL